MQIHVYFSLTSDNKQIEGKHTSVVILLILKIQ